MPRIKETVRIKPDQESGVALIQDKYTSLEKFHALEERFERFINQPAIKDAVENHKSNWVANSKGGEPNHKR